MSDKPVPSEGLNAIWNNNQSNNSQPSNAKVDTGWEQNERPPVEYMNWLQHYITKMLAHVNIHGIPLWDSITEYEQFSLVKGLTTGNVYSSTVNNNQGNDPESTPAAWSIYDPGVALTTDVINNTSGVSGATATDAFNTINAWLLNPPLSSNDIANASSVSGVTATDAFNTLLAAIAALNSNDILNTSNRPGNTVTDVLNFVKYQTNESSINLTFASFNPIYSVAIEPGIYEYEFMGFFTVTSGGIDYGLRYDANVIENKIAFTYESDETPTGDPSGALLASRHVENNVPADIDFISLTDAEINNTGIHPYRFRGTIKNASSNTLLTVEARQTTANGLTLETLSFFRVERIL